MSIRAFSRLSPWRSCHGPHRKLSNSIGGLQSHFQLPSGDRIPSVVLGAISRSKSIAGNELVTLTSAVSSVVV